MPRLLQLPKAVFLLMACAVLLPAHGQTNLLSNGGFEQIELDTGVCIYVNVPIDPQRINDTAIGWNFIKRRMVPVYVQDWSFQNYGWHTNQTYYSDSGCSHTGKVFAVITPYDVGYKQTLTINNLTGRLCAPLVARHLYKVSFYVKAFEGNCYTNQISIAFTENFMDAKYILEKDEITKPGADLPIEKAYTVSGILENKTYQQFSFEYRAKGNEQYIYIGNFHLGYLHNNDSKKTEWFGIDKSVRKTPFIEYAIDDIVVEPVDVSEGCGKTVAISNSKSPQLALPDTLQLPGIYFDYDDTIAVYAFAKLADTLKAFDNYKRILVYGFTDNAGSLTYNQQLSEQRAQFVAQKRSAITNKIIVSKGMGLSNATLDAKLQRRVDIYLVK